MGLSINVQINISLLHKDGVNKKGVMVFSSTPAGKKNDTCLMTAKRFILRDQERRKA